MTSASDDSIASLPPVADLSYEQARDELVALVARIESGQVPLEEAMTLWGRGEELAAHCQTKLDAAQETLDRSTDRGEQARTAPAAAPEDAASAASRDDAPAEDAAPSGPSAPAEDDDATDDPPGGSAVSP